MENKDEIIEKIRKLMALAERGGTEAEADSAMCKVQELLTKYNLDMDAVKKPDEVVFTQDHHVHEWNASWLGPIYMGVAELYFCHTYVEKNGQDCRRHYIVGKPVNVETVKFVVNVVIATGKRLAKSYAQECFQEWQMNPVSASNDFKKGYSSRIFKRCREMIKAGNEVKESNSRALVIAFRKNELAAIDLFEKKDLGLNLVNAASMRGAGDQDHANAGANAANSVSLTANAIGSSGGRTMRIGNKG